MSELKSHYSAREIAELRLPGMPATQDGVKRRLAVTPAHLTQPRARKAGGTLYALDALPEAARTELQRRHKAPIEARALTVAGGSKPPAKRQNDCVPVASLTYLQRDNMIARRVVLAEIEHIAIAGGHGITAAISIFVADYRKGLLSDELMDAVRRANDRKRGLSERTVHRWRERRKEGEAALARTNPRNKEPAPDWLDDFLPHYSRPQKPELAVAYREWIATLPDADRPSYSAVRRAVAKLSHVEQNMGREGRLKLRARQAYVVRDFADLQPTTIYTADGTTFDAEVEHPIHGRPFKPEITIVVDVATRKAVGWSAGLAESQMTVADALARACAHGIPAIFYTDRGSGYRNIAMTEEVAGLLSRLGATPMHSLPQHSWSRGVIENWQKRWISVAKKFPTYGRADMDREARQLAFRTTRREIALVGKSHMLPTWEAFATEIAATVDAYNDHPHRALPWTRDPATGSKRHLTPNELWRQKAAGCDLVIPDEHERADLFRPYEVRRVRRCMVTLGTNSYFAIELDAFHEQDVMVGFDVRDAGQVWIRRIDMHEGQRRPGAFVCVAAFEGNKTRYIPVSMEQAALEKRAEGRRRRLADKLDRVEAELRPSALLTLRPAAAAIDQFSMSQVLSGETSAIHVPDGEMAAGLDASQVSRAVDPAASHSGVSRPAPREDGRPHFFDETEFALWIADHPSEADALDRELVVELLTSEASKAVLRNAGVDLGRLRAVVVENAA